MKCNQCGSYNIYLDGDAIVNSAEPVWAFWCINCGMIYMSEDEQRANM